jgi:hypothetical protein
MCMRTKQLTLYNYYISQKTPKPDKWMESSWIINFMNLQTLNKTLWLQPASELYRLSDHCLSAKLVPTFAGRGCCVVSATNLHGHKLRFSTLQQLLFIQVAPQLSSRGLADPVPDPLLIRKSSRPGNWTRDLWICSQKLWPLDHRGSLYEPWKILKLKITICSNTTY